MIPVNEVPYVVTVKQDGEEIFRAEVIMTPERSFSEDIASAIAEAERVVPDLRSDPRKRLAVMRA